MTTKPSNLIYGLHDKPPHLVTFFLGFQHVCIFSIALIFPVIIVRKMGGTEVMAAQLVSISMLAAGIGTIAQAITRGPVGSGYLCPQVNGPSFLSASILAAKTGGLSLLFGMTIIAGVFEALFSSVINRLRVLFPPEVTGLIVAMVGISITRVAVGMFLDLNNPDEVMKHAKIMTAMFTLVIMVGLNVWSKGKLRLFSIIIGMTAGYVFAWMNGILGDADFAVITSSTLVWFPLSDHPGWTFDIHLLIPFLVAMICSSLKSVGDLTTCQKINDVAWKRSDMKNIKKGILADSIGCICAGLFGAMGQSTSSTNVGLSIATGATCRVIAFATGGLLIILAFCPKLSSIFAIMPEPVMGAILIFAVAFMIIAGLQIIMSRMMDSRKTFVVGLSIIFGLGVDMMPGAYTEALPHWSQPIFSSSLSAATILAIILNLVFRIGISKKASINLTPGVDSSDQIFTFMDRQGGMWGARKEVIYNAISAMNELFETVSAHSLTDEIVTMEAYFDEYKLDVDIHYKGALFEFPLERPDKNELRTDPNAVILLAGFLIRQFADKATCLQKGEVCQVALHFEH